MRDLPLALADLGWQPTVLTPAYGVFAALPGAEKSSTIEVPFGNATHTVSVIAVPGPDRRVRHIALDHELFSPQGPGKIYCNDGPDRPFATDAAKFAFFCAAAATYIRRLDPSPDIVHLHDWHTALYCALRDFDPQYRALQSIRTVFTIHNLAFQGIRPRRKDPSSFETWFPRLDSTVNALGDPRHSDCINLMATAIRLADKVNAVSPAYAAEILQPGNPRQGFIGGAGLEKDLQHAARNNRLTGILNGCDYSKRNRRRPGWCRLLQSINIELMRWQLQDDENKSIHDIAAARLLTLPKRRPANVLVSIGRLTSQKADLFLHDPLKRLTPLEKILEQLGKQGVFIMLGSGQDELQQRFADIALRCGNFLFLCGYSEPLSEMLYKGGDLFLMPSSFEPCGISQMLAMRSAQPCVVHGVGGLKDTVRNDVNGFVFCGDNPGEQADKFVTTVGHALRLKKTDPDTWQDIRAQAAAARFSWRASAEHYVGNLYA